MTTEPLTTPGIVTEPQHAPASGRLSVLAAILVAALILPLSFSGGAIATPAIGRDLGGSATALTWITNAFMLTFGSLMMTAGALADQYGRKRVFGLGVGLFTLVSLGLSFAPSILMVDLLRAVQGIGAAGALAAGSAALAQEFDGRARTRAFSLLGTTFGVGLAFGPLIAGWLIEAFGWRSVFMTSTLVGAAALVFGVPRLRETRDPDAQGLDWLGAVSFTAMLALFTFGIIQAPESGWVSPDVLGPLAGSVVVLGLFIWSQKLAERPMLDLSLFSYSRFLGVQMLPIATGFTYVVLLIMLPLRFIGIVGMSEVQAGLMMMALSLPMLVVPTIAASLARRLPAGMITGAGLLMAAAGLVWLGQIPSGAGFAAVPAMLIIGIGAGFPWGLMDGLSVSVVPRERSGMAAGIFNTTKVASEGVTLAIVSAVLAMLAGFRLNDLALGDATQQVAQRLATGDLAEASRMVPAADPQVLVLAYDAAFQTLTYGLAAFAVISALMAFRLLNSADEY